MEKCSAADLQNYIQAPEQGSGLNSGLLQTWAPLGSHTSSRFAWLSAAGLLHGRLRLDHEQRPPNDTEYLDMEPDVIALHEGQEQIRNLVRLLRALQAYAFGITDAHIRWRLERGLACYAGTDRIPLPRAGLGMPAHLQPHQWTPGPGAPVLRASWRCGFSRQRSLHHAAARR